MKHFFSTESEEGYKDEYEDYLAKIDHPPRQHLSMSYKDALGDLDRIENFQRKIGRARCLETYFIAKSQKYP